MQIENTKGIPLSITLAEIFFPKEDISPVPEQTEVLKEILGPYNEHLTPNTPLRYSTKRKQRSR